MDGRCHDDSRDVERLPIKKQGRIAGITVKKWIRSAKAVDVSYGPHNVR